VTTISEMFFAVGLLKSIFARPLRSDREVSHGDVAAAVEESLDHVPARHGHEHDVEGQGALRPLLVVVLLEEREAVVGEAALRPLVDEIERLRIRHEHPHPPALDHAVEVAGVFLADRLVVERAAMPLRSGSGLGLERDGLTREEKRQQQDRDPDESSHGSEIMPAPGREVSGASRGPRRPRRRRPARRSSRSGSPSP
jgi:hypothetical protein